MSSKLKGFDIYGEQINLTYKGEDSFKTMPGALVSILIITLLTAYSGYRIFVLLTRNESSISKSTF